MVEMQKKPYFSIKKTHFFGMNTSAVLVKSYKITGGTKNGKGPGPSQNFSGAENGTRTRDPQLGKLMLYQLSYFRKNRGVL